MSKTVSGRRQDSLPTSLKQITWQRSPRKIYWNISRRLYEKLLDKYLSGLHKVDIYGPPSENVSRL
jgi:hypothetical protein